MKNNHHPVDKIRVCDLKKGDKVLLSGKEFLVTIIDEKRITLRNYQKHTQYYNRNSQQYVELVIPKIQEYETKAQNKEAESLSQ